MEDYRIISVLKEKKFQNNNKKTKKIMSLD